ncbi:hypothetical protein HaLaN_17260 [Haematococcus lacustris]|uniref:Uncharacterized protein n=1 Tax=Haematococcus lacustris TaxID=44745 RepID=A0A699ZNW1_HAELA|nr:hypothetical protein HaLaN_17260 [Haematococcus lacustris]
MGLQHLGLQPRAFIAIAVSELSHYHHTADLQHLGSQPNCDGCGCAGLQHAGQEPCSCHGKDQGQPGGGQARGRASHWVLQVVMVNGALPTKSGSSSCRAGAAATQASSSIVPTGLEAYASRGTL